MDNLRVDGRARDDYRCMEVETDVVSNTSGSARIRLANTDVLVGVKAEVKIPRTDAPNKGYLEFFVDCSANATPEFEGRGGEDLATSISMMMYQTYRSCNGLRLKSLCIVPRQKCWCLYVDILLLQCGGNLYDVVSLAVKAALYNTKIPQWTTYVEDKNTVDVEYADDPFDCLRLTVTRVPCIVTLNKIGEHHIVDASSEEEVCTLARLMVGVTANGLITGLRKEDGGSLRMGSIQQMTQTASKVGMILHRDLMAALEEEEREGKLHERSGFLR